MASTLMTSVTREPHGANQKGISIPNTEERMATTSLTKQQITKQLTRKLSATKQESIAAILHDRIQRRDAMGHYRGKKPLTSLECPLPSPSDYDPKLPNSGCQFSIQGKNDFVLDHSLAGPGPAVHFAANSNENHHNGYSFGTKLKEIKGVNCDTPSPSAYNDPRTIGKDSLAFSISGWQRAPVQESSPAPAKYNINLPNSSPKYTFGQTFGRVVEITPSPQQYEPVWVKPGARKAPAITMSSKFAEIISKDTIPAPNNYFPKPERSQKTASLKGWYKESKSLKTPGPANYILPNNLFSGPQIGLTPKHIEPNIDQVTAGPSDYNPNLTLTRNSQPKHSLGQKRDLRGLTSSAPSPAAYSPKDRQIRHNDGPKATLKSRHSNVFDNKLSPGPADYIQLRAFMDLTPAQLARIQHLKNTAQKPRACQTTTILKTPGPSDYSVSKIGGRGAAYSLGKRLESQKISDYPSANAYNPDIKNPKMGIAMKSRSSPFVMVFPTNRFDTLRV